MAGNYFVNDSDREIQVISPTLVRPVEYVGIFTLPSHVYARYPVGLELWVQNQGADLLGTLATSIEGLISGGLAVTAQYMQDQDENGLLVDYLDFLVRYVPPDGIRGPLDSRVLVPEELLVAQVDPFLFATGNSAADMLATEYDRLKALAGQ